MYKDWNIEAVTGYKPQTTFYTDLSMIEPLGTEKLRFAVEEMFESWKTNVVYITELIMALNWKIWEHFGADNDEYAEVYDELWKKYDAWACDNLTGEDLKYYYKTTD